MSNVFIETEKEYPAQIDREYFRTRYGQNFPDLLSKDKNEVLDSCIEAVYTLFNGVKDIWKHLDRKVYVDKTQLCYGLLTAWYITDLMPEYAIGVTSSGGIPVKAKKIGGVSIQFAEQADTRGAFNNADLLSSLKSNAFGSKAYMMIKTSGKLNFFLQR